MNAERPMQNVEGPPGAWARYPELRKAPAAHSRSTVGIRHSARSSPVAGEEQTTTLPAPAVAPPRLAPRWHVVLINDDDHTYEYVIEMLGKLFHYDLFKSFAMAREVDTTGRVIVETTVLERAEFKRDQIHAYGADWRIDRCKGSMRAVLEPAE